MTTLQKNIKQLLKQRGLKQKYIAQKAGYSEKDFSAMINGRKNIYDDDVLIISKAFGLTPNDLFGIGREIKQ